MHWSLHYSDTEWLKVRLARLKDCEAKLTLLPLQTGYATSLRVRIPLTRMNVILSLQHRFHRRRRWWIGKSPLLPGLLLANSAPQTIDTALYVVESTATKLTLRNAKTSDCIQGSEPPFVVRATF